MEQGREPLTYGVDARIRSPGHITGRRVLSPLRHPWFSGRFFTDALVTFYVDVY